MKKFVLALTALSALAATPAMARSETHISFGFYAPAPVYYEPAPVVYYPPVHHVYYAPPCPERVVYGYGPYYGRGYAYGRRFHRGYDTAWNAPRGDYDDDRRGYNRDDDGDRDHGYGRR